MTTIRKAKRLAEQEKRRQAHLDELLETQGKRVALLESQIRSLAGSLEAERAELLARVGRIDALLLISGRTRSASPDCWA